MEVVFCDKRLLTPQSIMTQEPFIAVPRAASNEAATSSRYGQSCDRPTAYRAIVQWTHSGYGCVDFQKKRWKVPPEHAFIVVQPEKSRYYYPAEATEPWIFDWADFMGPLALNLFRKFRARFGPVVPLRENSSAAIHLRRLIENTESLRPRDRWKTSIEAYTFFTEWWRESAGNDDPTRTIETIISLCETSYYHRFTVKELAAECGMSREHFTRIFSRHAGISPAAFLRKRRLKAAEAMLRGSDLTLGEIAHETGFASGRHLMEAFRRYHGVTTEAYRSAAQTGDRKSRPA